MFIRWVMDSWVGNYPFGPNSVIDLGHQFLKLNGPFFLLLVGVVWLGLRPWSYTRHDVSLVLGLSPAQVCLVGDLSWTSPWRHVNDRFCSVDPTIGFFLVALSWNHWSNNKAILSRRKSWMNELWFQSNPNRLKHGMTKTTHWSVNFCSHQNYSLYYEAKWVQRTLAGPKSGSKSLLSNTTHNHFDEYV